ncbi:MAG: response regulator, partial [Alphaproteobacteria bacterium]|nr:response regulator [Alphaproteobacteria bacterium]
MAENWRELAEEARALANNLTDRKYAVVVLRIASLYDDMADRAESEARHISITGRSMHDPAQEGEQRQGAQPNVPKSSAFPVPTGERSLSGAVVLVVEDEPSIAADIAEIIKLAGGNVLGPAATVDRALEFLQRERPNAATLDTNLKSDSSARIVSRLLAMGVPFVVVTGYRRESLPDRIQVAPYVGKPYEPSDIVGALIE